MRKYFLGVDGGGTKTHCALFNYEGRLIDFIEWGTTSHEFMAGGYKELSAVLCDLFHRIEQKNSIEWEQTEVVLGMAGVDCEAQRSLIGGFISDCGVRHFHLCNDSYLGVKAGSDKAWGISSLNGSGTGACGIDQSGNSCIRGGWFELSGDYAGGRILGTEVVNHVYDMLFRDGNRTIMAELLMREMGQRDKVCLMDSILCGICEQKLEAKSFAPILFEAANEGDKVAKDILSRCGKQNARDIAAVMAELDFEKEESIPIVLIGSLYIKGSNGIIIDVLNAELNKHVSDYSFHFIKLEYPPVLGAVYWAMQRAGIEIDKKRLIRELR